MTSDQDSGDTNPNQKVTTEMNNQGEINKQLVAMSIQPSTFLQLLVLSLLAALYSNSGNAVEEGWLDKSPSGGLVVDFAMAPSNPATIYAAGLFDNAGIWKSTNSGGTWSHQVTGTGYSSAGVKVSDSDIALAGMQNSTIHRTTNGATWAETAGSGNLNKWKYSFSTSSPNTVYAGGFTSISTGLLRKSTDGGATWSVLSVDGDATPGIYALAVDPQNADTVYVGASPTGNLNDGLFKSTDGGASWTLLTGLRYTAIEVVAVDPNNSSIIYAGTATRERLPAG